MAWRELLSVLQDDAAKGDIVEHFLKSGRVGIGDQLLEICTAGESMRVMLQPGCT